MPRSDEEIMLEYQSGEKEALVLIFERYKIRLLNFCTRLLGNRADAEEVASDVFLTLFHATFDEKRGVKFSTWLYTIARNQCINRIRRRKYSVSMWFSSKDSDAYEQWEIPDSRDCSREELAKNEAAAQVRQAIDKLPAEQKEAIVLRQYHDFSYEEISHILGCSLEKVKILIFRAKERLRVELASFIKEERS